MVEEMRRFTITCPKCGYLNDVSTNTVRSFHFKGLASYGARYQLRCLMPACLAVHQFGGGSEYKEVFPTDWPVVSEEPEGYGTWAIDPKLRRQ